jgi:hypothetical protein
MFKACQYAINDTKTGVEMKEMNVAKVQSALQKNHYMNKEVREG